MLGATFATNGGQVKTTITSSSEALLEIKHKTRTSRDLKSHMKLAPEMDPPNHHLKSDLKLHLKFNLKYHLKSTWVHPPLKLHLKFDLKYLT